MATNVVGGRLGAVLTLAVAVAQVVSSVLVLGLMRYPNDATVLLFMMWVAVALGLGIITAFFTVAQFQSKGLPVGLLILSVLFLLWRGMGFLLAAGWVRSDFELLTAFYGYPTATLVYHAVATAALIAAAALLIGTVRAWSRHDDSRFASYSYS